MIFKQGKNTPLNQNSGTLPDVSGALIDWFQPMIFGVVTKSVQNFQAYEEMVEVAFQGVWQPLQGKQLALKPEGQRAWNWFQLHAEPSLVLDIDQVVLYLGVQYRVMSQKDYSLYGYIEYHFVSDWENSGPTVVE